MLFTLILSILAGRGLAAPATTSGPIGQCSTTDCFRNANGDVFTTQTLFDFRNGKPPKFDDFFMALDNPAGGYQGMENNQNTMRKENCQFKADHLELLTNKKNGQQYSTSVESKDGHKVFYGSFRARFSVTGSAGGVAGFFTFLDGGQNEADIEILTNEPKSQIHYTNHLTDGGPNPTLQPNVNGLDWSQYRTHRFDWTNKATTFFLDDKQTGKLDKGMPTKESTLIMNMWSSGPKWGGVMKDGEQAIMSVQWMQAFYNQSATAGSKKCTTFCDI